MVHLDASVMRGVRKEKSGGVRVSFAGDMFALWCAPQAGDREDEDERIRQLEVTREEREATGARSIAWYAVRMCRRVRMRHEPECEGRRELPRGKLLAMSSPQQHVTRARMPCAAVMEALTSCSSDRRSRISLKGRTCSSHPRIWKKARQD